MLKLSTYAASMTHKTLNNLLKIQKCYYTDVYPVRTSLIRTLLGIIRRGQICSSQGYKVPLTILTGLT